MKKLFLTVLFLSSLIHISAQDLANPKSDVYLQGFYWNSPPGGIWWDSLAKIAPRLASAGFSGIWFPSPVKGGGGGFSMGYDPYDHYDFGDYNQKGSKETRFGSKEELINAIRAYHNVGIQVFADAVMNHMNGAEGKQPYECRPSGYADSGWTQFDYPGGSGRFKKNASYFYPNSQTCNVNPPYHGASDPLFQFGIWLAKDRQFVRDSLIAWGRYLKNDLGFDGFRLDAVKSIDPNFIGPWLNATNGNAYAVAEYYGNVYEITDWFNQVRNNHSASISMFDFPLRFTLRDMCNNRTGSFNMTFLDNPGLNLTGMSGFNISTWVENHDVDRIGWDGTIDNGHDPIIYDKAMAYAFIMFSEGRPSVFFKDYFDYGFGRTIDTLIFIRQNFLGGGTTRRGGLNAYYIRQDGNQDQNALMQDLFVARRNGFGTQKGGYLVMNDNPTQWIDVWVDTEEPVGTKYKDFTGKDANKIVVGPAPGGLKNRVKLWAPPRSYTLYAADTVTNLNNPPVIMPVPDLTAYTNSNFFYKLNVFDANRDSLSFSLAGNPSWLLVTSAGILQGVPGTGSTGTANVVVTISDNKGGIVADTFMVTVLLNRAPVIQSLADTTTKATKRFERRVQASDIDGDSLSFSLKNSPAWLTISSGGLMSGTPAVTDTGASSVKVMVTDGKGAYDSTAFLLRVRPNADSIIATYAKPLIDGLVNVGTNDWRQDWKVVTDNDTDSYWHHGDTLDNELKSLYVTWDADSLYLGINYYLNDFYNTMILYLDAGLPRGITNFNSNAGYLGDYAKNFRLRRDDGIDFFAASYYRNNPIFYQLSDSNSTDISAKVNSKRGPLSKDAEIAVAWNTLYNLGAGLVPLGVKLKVVTVVAGGFNWGAGDAMPDNPDVNGDAGPDSLVNLVLIQPDKDNNGIPDPTVFINDVQEGTNIDVLPTAFKLYQNHPNPFNPVTVIRFSVPVSGVTSVKIYDVLGNEIKVLAEGYRQAGEYSLSFNASGLPSGVYFYALQSGNYSSVKKMILMK